MKGSVQWKPWHQSADEQLAWIARLAGSGEAAAYAALIPGNRLAAEGRWDEASAAYARVRQQYASDPQVRYRVAQLHFLRGDTSRAVPELKAVVDDRSSPDWVKTQAMLTLARAHDLGGQRAEAMKLYARVAEEHERDNIGWAAKVGLVTPYQRPKR